MTLFFSTTNSSSFSLRWAVFLFDRAITCLTSSLTLMTFAQISHLCTADQKREMDRENRFQELLVFLDYFHSLFSNIKQDMFWAKTYLLTIKAAFHFIKRFQWKYIGKWDTRNMLWLSRDFFIFQKDTAHIKYIRWYTHNAALWVTSKKSAI